MKFILRNSDNELYIVEASSLKEAQIRVITQYLEEDQYAWETIEDTLDLDLHPLDELETI